MKRLLALSLLASCVAAEAGPRRRGPEAPPEEMKAPPLCQAAKDAGMWMAEDGTLFRKIDFQEPFYIPLDTLAAIERFLRAFQEVGVQVVVPLIPTRALGMPAQLEGSADAPPYDRAGVEASYIGTLRWLELNGVLAVDLMPTILAPGRDRRFFHRYDHHWTAEGARDAAEATAAVVRASAVADRLPQTPQRTARVGESQDVARMAQRVAQLCDVAMPPSTYSDYVTQPAQAQSLGLLDEPVPPEVVVAGSSFMAERFHYGGFLAQALSTDVLTAQTGGGQAHGGLHDYLLSDDYRAHKPAVLVWEMVMSFIMTKQDTDEAPGFLQPDIYRELTAAVYGDCGAEAVLESRERAAGVVELDLLDQGLASDGLYLSLDFPQGGVERLEVETRTHIGAFDRYSFPVYSRLDRKGRFMLTLDPELPGDVTTLKLRFPEDVNAPMIARVCLAP
ncbi:MAG: hypothetical protein H6741_31265 [Alphaproteobacteria bacterium]|nr:hypothetical protein [Alphaproteobacteria bacterium]